MKHPHLRWLGKEMIGISTIENCVDAKIQAFKEYTKNTKIVWLKLTVIAIPTETISEQI